MLFGKVVGVFCVEVVGVIVENVEVIGVTCFDGIVVIVETVKVVGDTANFALCPLMRKSASSSELQVFWSAS